MNCGLSTVSPITSNQRVLKMSIYQQNGYKSRREYLECMADEYDVPFDTVLSLSLILGSNEDFDGLISAISDINDSEQ